MAKFSLKGLRNLGIATYLISFSLLAVGAPQTSIESSDPLFNKLIQMYLAKCAKGYAFCDAPFKALEHKDSRLNSTPFLEAAALVAVRWENSFFEGDYESTGPHQLVSVVEIYENNVVVAYALKVMQPAVYTGTESCNKAERWSGDCIFGNVYETVYFSPDFKIDLALDYPDFE